MCDYWYCIKTSNMTVVFLDFIHHLEYIYFWKKKFTDSLKTFSHQNFFFLFYSLWFCTFYFIYLFIFFRLLFSMEFTNLNFSLNLQCNKYLTEFHETKWHLHECRMNISRWHYRLLDLCICHFSYQCTYFDDFLINISY